MVVLIASHRSALLLYCLPPSYNFIFTIHYRFLIRLGLGDHSITFSLVNNLCSKNSHASLDTRNGALLCINTHLTVRLGFVSGQESLVPKIAIVSTVQFNPLTLNRPTMVWSKIPAHIITLLLFYCLLSATSMSELDKIYC